MSPKVDFTSIKSATWFTSERGNQGCSLLQRIFALLSVLFLFNGLSLSAADAKSELQLFDGTSLHGELLGLQLDQGLIWKHPAVHDPIIFRPNNLASIRLPADQGPPESFQPTSKFRFKNGDEIFGNLLSMKDGQFEFETWFAGRIKAHQESLEAIGFSAGGFRVIYEGPTSLDGWTVGKNSRPWKYEDGALVAKGPDILGRNFSLKTSSNLEFDLTWSAAFSLTLTLYAQTIDRFDYSANAYIIYIGQGGLTLQRVTAGQGAILLGNAQLPTMLTKNTSRFEIRSNIEDGSIGITVDGVPAGRWKDSSGFVAKGGGIVFYSQTDGPELKLSKMRLTALDGRFEPETGTNAPATNDVVFLANKDRVTGKIEGIHDGKVKVLTRSTHLEIPMGRVVQMVLAKSQNRPAATDPWTTRATLVGGENLLMDILQFKSGRIRGSTVHLGEIEMNTSAVRQLQFNLNRPPPGVGDLGLVLPEVIPVGR